MALPRLTLVFLCFLPLLGAQSPVEANTPAPANITAKPITNDTLTWLSGKWFFIGSAFRNPEYQEEAQKIQAEWFHFDSYLSNDTILLREYQTRDDRCVSNSSYLTVNRENGTLSQVAWGVEHVAHLKLLGNFRSFMLGYTLEDEKNRGLSLYADRTDVAPELLKAFEESITHAGMNKSEITYIDWKKDKCEPQQKPPELVKLNTTEGS